MILIRIVGLVLALIEAILALRLLFPFMRIPKSLDDYVPLLVTVSDWLYQNNDWARSHPIFKGLPMGLLDYQFYREILGDKFFSGQAPPAEVVAGMINTALDYGSGLTVAVYRHGEGRLVLNSLLVRENLSVGASHPVAERLLRNMLIFARGDRD